MDPQSHKMVRGPQPVIAKALPAFEEAYNIKAGCVDARSEVVDAVLAARIPR